MMSLANSALAAFVLLVFTSPTANTAATGASAECDAALEAHNPLFPDGTCVAVDGTCPASCLASFEALESSCAGQKYTHVKQVDGKDTEVALDWNTDKAEYLFDYQMNKEIFGEDGACHEIIHDYQLKHINDCNEAHTNILHDITIGWYCREKSTATTCAPECQESIDKLESVCNPAGGPIGKYTTTADDLTTTIEQTYSSTDMAAIQFFGPDSCKYTTSISGAASAGFSVALFVTFLAAPLFLLA